VSRRRPVADTPVRMGKRLAHDRATLEVEGREGQAHAQGSLAQGMELLTCDTEGIA